MPCRAETGGPCGSVEARWRRSGLLRARACRRTLLRARSRRSRIVPVKRGGGADQREMNKALRKVAQELMRLRSHLLGVKTDVVRQRQQRIHQLRGLVVAARERERLDEPERAADEHAFATAQTIRPE